MSESSIVKSILGLLNALPQARFIKTHGSIYRRGEPDIIGCIRGRMVVIEVKRPGESARPDQLAVLGKWARAGAGAMCVSSREEVEEYLQKLDRCAKA